MPLVDVFAELEAAQASGVFERYAIGGAVGATFYIEPAATQDLYVFVVFGPQAGLLLSIGPVYEYFRARGAELHGEHLVIAAWPVQFLPAATKLVEEALREAVRIDIEGQQVNVFSQEHLAAIALETNRLKDKLRLAQFLDSGSLDRRRFEELIVRFGLEEKWTRFQAFQKEQL